MFKLTLELIRTIETTLPFIFQLWEEEFILVRVSGGGWRVSGGGCRVAELAETSTNSVMLKLKLRLSLAKIGILTLIVVVLTRNRPLNLSNLHSTSVMPTRVVPS